AASGKRKNYISYTFLGLKFSSPKAEPSAMSLTPLMFRSVVRLVTSIVDEPAVSVTTILYYSELLPHNIFLERMVRRQLLGRENYLFHFIINFLRCFW
ncbi:hypothetical protein CICLE_v10010772mg, partial [Citrus x clementina]